MTQTRHIQAIGKAPAKLVEELTTDDTLLYNYGSTGRIVAVEQASPKFRAVTVATKSGEYTRRYKIGSLVAVTRY
jgi:hypothetical protein